MAKPRRSNAGSLHKKAVSRRSRRTPSLKTTLNTCDTTKAKRHLRRSRIYHPLGDEVEDRTRRSRATPSGAATLNTCGTINVTRQPRRSRICHPWRDEVDSPKSTKSTFLKWRSHSPPGAAEPGGPSRSNWRGARCSDKIPRDADKTMGNSVNRQQHRHNRITVGHQSRRRKNREGGREQEKSSATQHLELHPPPAPNWEYDETSRWPPFEFRMWAWCVHVCVHCVLAVFFVKGEPHESQVTATNLST